MKNMLTKYSVDILAILILLVWTIFFGILLITTVSPQRFHHFLLSDSLTMMTVIPEQVWIHRIPLKGEKPCPWEYLDYFSMYLEISDSVGSSDLLKFFSHRPQRCPWPWRFLRRARPDSAFPRCARKGQVPPWWRCWALSERGTCHTDVGRKRDPQAGIGGFLEPGVPPGCFWPHLRMCLDCRHGIISVWPLCIQPCEG